MNTESSTETYTRQVVDEVGHTLIPLCRKDKSGIRHVVGTGFFIQRLDRFYLITARHVYERCPLVGGEPLSHALEYAVGPIDWICVDKVCVASTHPLIKNGISKLDSDLIVLKTHRNFESVRHLPWGKRSIGYGCLLPTIIPRDTAEYVYGGLPVSKNEPRGSDEAARKPAHYMFLGASPPMDQYGKLGANYETHLLLIFDRVGNVGSLPRGKIFPGPRGMSGGPIFLYRAAADKEKSIGLVAVGLQTLHKQKYLVGVDIAAAMAGIEELAKARAI